jgi:hypothetical protein
VAVQDKVAAAAARYGVPVDLALKVAQVESGFNQNAMSGKGAVGVMQLMPGTASDLGVNPYNEDQNIDGGVRYLSQLYRQFGSWDTALAAYNFGPGNVSRGYAWPAETVAYVSSILGSGAGSGPVQTSAPNGSSIPFFDFSSSPLDTLFPEVIAENYGAGPSAGTYAAIGLGAGLVAWLVFS